MLIVPDLLASLSGMRLRARRPSLGQGIGQHASRSRGAGLEFAQYRAYEPGDELRRIDWKLYGRSDRFFVRDAERDSPLTAWAIVDASASMGQADTLVPERTRLAAARTLAACLFELAFRQGDRFGLVLIAQDRVFVTDAASGRRHRDRLHFELARAEAAGGWPIESSLHSLWQSIAPGAVVMMLSDGFEERALALAERLSAANRDVSFVRLLTMEEREFPFEGGPRFRDPESAQEQRVDAARVRADFLRRFGESRQALLARLAASGVRACEAFTGQPLDLPLRRLFGGRDFA
ncbi:DUF58 domain-containing protein [Hydrocarboniphaga effusa]|jgi:uncharacterized protein (DUF58 family)|uniref:DUF58 domain-containing protein n=1 Tax=Hydrocarboniphaga effusa AP103 TaxID=1172194 RepID=I8T4S4_9GAMM|nr:DUF58 domain-containing protein [Hydrocarboniphaga effusa]EIT68733.1 hypothetical protein WQQ_39280 [Hydrocarboniphaga effusa AP103]